jgi:hypothetical protein
MAGPGRGSVAFRGTFGRAMTGKGSDVVVGLTLMASSDGATAWQFGVRGKKNCVPACVF